MDDLELDVELTKGQVRRINAAHVDELVKAFGLNEPETLELIVWPDQGMYLLCPVLDVFRSAGECGLNLRVITRTWFELLAVNDLQSPIVFPVLRVITRT